jgi:Domain of unknown function (DUF1844)
VKGREKGPEPSHLGAAGGPKPRAPAEPAWGQELPTLDFSTFVLGIIGTAYTHLGDAPNPEGQEERDLQLARQDIDLLGLLQEKTKGNLTGEEERLMDQALYDLRMRFIEVSKGT